MRRFAHTSRLVGLLLGFYVLCAAIIAILLVLDVLATEGVAHYPALFKFVLILYAATVGAILIIGRGVFVSTRTRRRDRPGVPVSPRDEPRLYERVHAISSVMGTRPPVEIRLVGDVNAGVWEDAYLLGLIPGRRRMVIGVPLLLALTPEQFDAVIAHEIGHYSGGHTQAGALVGRTRGSVVSALRAAGRPVRLTPGRKRYHLPGAGLFHAIFAWYARLVLSVTEAASREQEYAADRVAADIAGHRNAAAALRELPALKQAYGFYLDRYASAGADIGLIPAPVELLGGFAGLLADPARRREIDEIRANPKPEKMDPYDSHPPISERVAAINALPDDGRPLDESPARAIALLANPHAALAGAGTAMLSRQAAGKRAVSWDEMAAAIGAHRSLEAAQPVINTVTALYGASQPLPIAAFLDAVDAGRLDEILDRLPRSSQAATAAGRIAREYAKTTLHSGLAGWVNLELAHRGAMRWQHSWASVGADRRFGAPLTVEAVDAALDAVTAVRPDCGPLRALLFPSPVPA